jgi:hypothetical protein
MAKASRVALIPIGERVANLEALVPGFVKTVNEMAADVKTLLAAHNTAIGEQTEKKRAETRRLYAGGLLGGLIGSIATAAAELFHHTH